MSRLSGSGFTENYRAVDGRIVCGGCGGTYRPADMEVVEVVRFEGASDPGDESVLYALDGGCGHRGLFVAAYGPDTSAADTAVLLELPAGPRRSE